MIQWMQWVEGGDVLVYMGGDWEVGIGLGSGSGCGSGSGSGCGLW